MLGYRIVQHNFEDQAWRRSFPPASGLQARGPSGVPVLPVTPVQPLPVTAFTIAAYLTSRTAVVHRRLTFA